MKRTRKPPIPLPIPEKISLRSPFLSSVPDSDGEDAACYGDEGYFAEVCAEGGEEFLGELRLALDAVAFQVMLFETIDGDCVGPLGLCPECNI